jgi:hypothetical protein
MRAVKRRARGKGGNNAGLRRCVRPVKVRWRRRSVRGEVGSANSGGVVCGVWLAVRSQISGRGKGADAKERKRQQEPRKG